MFVAQAWVACACSRLTQGPGSARDLGSPRILAVPHTGNFARCTRLAIGAPRCRARRRASGRKCADRLLLARKPVSPTPPRSFTLVSKSGKHAHPSLTVVGFAVKLLQMLNFPLVAAPWPPAMAPLQVVAGWTTMGPLLSLFTPTSYFAAFFLSAAWVAVCLGLCAWSAQALARGEVTRLWPLRVLSAIGAFSANVLFIPLMEMLLSAFSCGGGGAAHSPWQSAGYECFHGAHAGVVAAVVVLSAGFFCMCAFFVLVHQDSHALTASLAGKAHGRVDLAMLAVKVLLVLLITVVPPSAISGPPGAMGVLVAAGATWGALAYAYMPYTAHVMNCATLAEAGLLTWLAAVGAAAAARGGGNATDAAVQFYYGAPVVVICCIGLANHRRAALLTTPTTRLGGPFEVELKVRRTGVTVDGGTRGAMRRRARRVERR